MTICNYTLEQSEHNHTFSHVFTAHKVKLWSLNSTSTSVAAISFINITKNGLTGLKMFRWELVKWMLIELLMAKPEKSIRNW